MKRISLFLLVLVMIIGTVWTPASAKKKQAEIDFRIGGIVAPIREKWVKDLEEDGSALFYDEADEDTLFFVGAKPAGFSDEVDKLLKLLSKKSKKSKVLKALKVNELAPDEDVSTKNLKVKKDSSGKYMAILDLTLPEYGGAYYVVVRNIEDRFLAIYSIGSDSCDTLSKSIKKLILGYAKRIAIDDKDKTLKIVDNLTVPYDNSWILNYYDVYHDDDYVFINEAYFKVSEDISVEVRADYANADEDTKYVASLLKDEKNAEKLKNTLFDLMLINEDHIDESILENAFQMIPDGKGSYYITIDLVNGYIALNVIDDKYMIMALAEDDSEAPLPQGVKDSMLKLVTNAFIE